MRRSILVLALVATGCAALATERREEPETSVPVILPPRPGDVPETPPSEPPPAPAATGPLAPGQTWAGQYACPPGPADVTVRIERVRGTEIEATFELATGRYAMSGHYDTRSGALELVPTRWIVQSPSAPLVGLYGTVEGRTYEGRVTDATCRWFTLRSN